MSIAIELHSPFLQKTHRFFKIVKIKKKPYRFVPYLHPENSNGRCSGTILTGNTCVTVPVIGGGDIVDSEVLCYFYDKITRTKLAGITKIAHNKNTLFLNNKQTLDVHFIY